jgi:Fur family ferric uptake transcriptional regulator
MTRQRRVILDELGRLTTHPTAEELCQLVRRRLPRISLATVYRNLDILSQQGMIQKLETAGLQRRFDGNAAEHWHVRCIHCGRVADVTGAPSAVDRTGLRADRDYEIIGVRVEFIGICPDCKKARSSAAGKTGEKRQRREALPRA